MELGWVDGNGNRTVIPSPREEPIMWPFNRKNDRPEHRLMDHLVNPEVCKHPYGARVSEYRDEDGKSVFVGYHCEQCGTHFPSD